MLELAYHWQAQHGADTFQREVDGGWLKRKRIEEYEIPRFIGWALRTKLAVRDSEPVYFAYDVDEVERTHLLFITVDVIPPGEAEELAEADSDGS